MTKLLYKEFKLAAHPTSYIFLILSAMLAIPNYPYYVAFFYTGLALFFTCLSGRENRDVFYSVLLPVSKRDIVRARMGAAVILELLQMAAAVPFAVLRQGMDLPPNSVGMDANISLFAFTFVMYGIFNLIFFGIYYIDVQKVGKAFIVSSSAEFLYIGAAETLDHILPFMRDRLDTPEPMFLKEKIAALAAGIVIYAVMSFIAVKKAERSFEKQDI